MRQPRFFLTLVIVSGLLCPIGPTQGQPQPIDPPVDGTPVDEERRLRFLHDAALTLDQRAARVTALLDEHPEEAPQWLMRVLRTGHAKSRRAVLEAVLLLSDDGLRVFLPALFPLLAHDDDAVNARTVEVFARINDPAAMRGLAAVAAGRGNPVRQRLSAIHAMAHHPRREVVASLMTLIHDHEPPVQGASYAVLRNLTGLEDIPDDPEQWSQWWRQHSEMTAAQWQQALLRGLVERGRLAAARRQHLEGRLAEALRLLYLDADSERRTEFLVAWLDDPLPTIRDLAMDLVAQRLVDVGAEPVRESLRVALRHGLHAPHASQRRRSADALRQLGDPAAAALVSDKLSARVEQNTDVLGAYLRLLRHVPRREAIEPMIHLLGDPRMARLAADALAAALDAGDDDAPWITPQQSAMMRNVARHHLGGMNDETPSMIRLLGRIAAPGTNDDWQLISRFLDSDVDLVKDAAARAWAESNQPLTPLAARGADGVIQPFLYDAAIRRGAAERTFLAIAEHAAARPSLAQNRQQALVALAAKVSPEAVLQIADRFAGSEEDQALRVNLLAAALLALESNPSAEGNRFVTLLLTRAEALSDAGEWRRALADYERLQSDEAFSLTPWQRARTEFGTLRALLNTARIAEALAIAETMPRLDASDTPQLASLLLDAAKRSAEANKPDDARSILHFLRTSIDATPQPTMKEAIRALESRLETRPDAIDAADANREIPGSSDPGG